MKKLLLFLIILFSLTGCMKTGNSEIEVRGRDFEGKNIDLKIKGPFVLIY